MSELTSLLPTSAVGMITGGFLLASVGYRVINAQKAKLLRQRIVKMMPAVLAFWALFAVSIGFVSAGAGASLPPLSESIAGVASLTFTLFGLWFMNDILDKETDKHSNAHRATARGEVTDRESLAMAIIFCVVGGGYAATINLYAVAGVVWMIIINLLYSVPPIRLKSGAITSMVSAGLMGVAGVMIGSATVVSTPTTASLRLAVVILLFMVFNMSYKDLKDADHDAKSGVENFVVKIGRPRATTYLMGSFPISYVVGGILLGIEQPVPLAMLLILGIVASGVLYVSDTSSGITVHRLDLVNAVYFVTLTVSFII